MKRLCWSVSHIIIFSLIVSTVFAISIEHLSAQNTFQTQKGLNKAGLVTKVNKDNKEKDICDLFRLGISVSLLSTVPATLEATDELEVSLSVRVDSVLANSTGTEDWYFGFFEVRLSSFLNSQGADWFNSAPAYPLSRFYAPLKTTLYNFELRVPPNFWSLYFLTAHWATTNNLVECYSPVTTSISGGPPQIFVNNSAEKADVLPPYLALVQTNYYQYKPGQTISVKMLIYDKSDIDLESGHVVFQNEQGDEFGTFPATYTNLSNNFYGYDLAIPKDTPQGIYYLEILNVFDIYGNGGAFVYPEFGKAISVKIE